MNNKYVIDKVLRKRGFIEVVFINSANDKKSILFADKFGQYKLFKLDKKRREEYDLEWIEAYCKLLT